MEVSRFPPFLSTAFAALLSLLDARIRERAGRILAGVLLACDRRRTASTWFRAGGIGVDFKSAYKHIAAVGREAVPLAGRVLRMVEEHPAASGDRVLFALDDTLSKRYGPQVEGAGLHHNPTPGPAGSDTAFGHNFVVAARIVRHPDHGTIALPLRAELYVRKCDVPKLPKSYGIAFRTKLELAVGILQWLAAWLASRGKSVWIAADGAYASTSILDACRKHGFTLVSRLRKDAALHEVPKPSKKGKNKRGRPRKYGVKRVSLAGRAAHAQGWTTETVVLYGRPQVKAYKTFLATWRPAGGVIRVVLVKEADGWIAFFSNNPDATAAEILGAVADRNALEQAFKDVKEVWGAGRQQLRNLHANVGAFHLNLWMMTLTELWAWDLPDEALVDRRDRPWDNQPRRPSHNDQRKSLQRLVLRDEFNRLPQRGPGSRLIRRAFERLLQLAA